MGTRINYEIMLGDESGPAVVLFSNSHHESEHPDLLFRQAVQIQGFPTSLTRYLLNATYQTASGAHKPGEPMFSVDLEPGDREFVVRVTADRVTLTYGPDGVTPHDPG